MPRYNQLLADAQAALTAALPKVPGNYGPVDSCIRRILAEIERCKATCTVCKSTSDCPGCSGGVCDAFCRCVRDIAREEVQWFAPRADPGPFGPATELEPMNDGRRDYL